MKIKILSKGLKVNNDIERYIKAKINFLESKLGGGDKEEKICNFRIGMDSASKKTGNVYFAEANIETSKKNYGARAEASSVYEAIDELKDELYKKIRRHKDKKESYLKRGGRFAKDFLKKFMK